MNPVLLKPSSETGSQVIVLGKPVGHMTVRQYHAFQAELWPIVTAAYERLLAANDLDRDRGRRQPGRDQPARAGHRQHEDGMLRALPGAPHR